MRFLAFKLHLGRARLDVFVQDEDGTIREVAVGWRTKITTNLIPRNWKELVLKEVQLQRSEEAAAKSGRVLF